MSSTAEVGPIASGIARAIAWLVASKARCAALLVTLLVLAGLALAYGKSIRVDTDLRALLPATAPSVIALETIEARKGSAEQLVVAVESPDDAANAAMIEVLVAEVGSWSETESLTSVRDFTPLRDHALYFLDLEQLVELRKTLSDQHKRAVARALGPGLTGDPIDPDAVGGNDWDDPTEGDELDWGPPAETPPAEAPPAEAPPAEAPPEAPPQAEPPKAEPFDLDRFLTEQREQLVAQGKLEAKEVDLIWPREDEQGHIVWEERVGQPYVSDKGDVRVLKASLSRPATDVQFSQEVVRRIESAVAAAKARGIAVDARVEVVAAYDVSKEVDTIVRDANRATWISATLIIVVLVVGFWSARALTLVLVPMAVSMALTLAVATALYGVLNALTVFLFAVLFGMGVDFAVHLFAQRQAQMLWNLWARAQRLDWLSHVRMIACAEESGDLNNKTYDLAYEWTPFSLYAKPDAVAARMQQLARQLLAGAVAFVVGPSTVADGCRTAGMHVQAITPVASLPTDWRRLRSAPIGRRSERSEEHTSELQ